MPRNIDGVELTKEEKDHWNNIWSDTKSALKATDVIRKARSNNLKNIQDKKASKPIGLLQRLYDRKKEYSDIVKQLD
jgi:hypothetical protein